MVGRCAKSGSDLPLSHFLVFSTPIVLEGYNPRMKFMQGRTAILILAFASTVHADPLSTAADKQISQDVRRVLEAQEAAWNRGDIVQFMEGYAKSDQTTFVSGENVTRGWQTVMDRYRAKYSDREKMGTLTFSELEITPLAPDAAVVLGRWELKRPNDNPHGHFTLIFRKTADGWRIVQDHTSSAQ